MLPNNAVRLPAEWEPQAGIMLTWPHDRSDWAGTLIAADANLVAIASAISCFETVLVVCRDESHRDYVGRLLASLDQARLHLVIAPSNDIWARDHGPVTVHHDGAVTLLDFNFNGWGNRYRASLDNRITATLHANGHFSDTPMRNLAMVLEGGAIDSDGQGTLLATRRTVCDARRNPNLDTAAIEQQLGEHLGSHRILWIEHGLILGDDSGGHIDMLARFCTPGTIACATCNDEHDAHFEPLQRLREELGELKDRDGRRYRIVELPLPAPRFNAAGQRLPASYTNFLILNGAVLVPTWSDPADNIARSRLAECFPDRAIIGIACNTLITQNGGLHCAAMHLPQGVKIPA